jgi:hypothetical protein
VVTLGFGGDAADWRPVTDVDRASRDPLMFVRNTSRAVQVRDRAVIPQDAETEAPEVRRVGKENVRRKYVVTCFALASAP